MVISRVAQFQDGGLDVLVLHVTKGAVIEVSAIYIK